MMCPRGGAEKATPNNPEPRVVSMSGGPAPRTTPNNPEPRVVSMSGEPAPRRRRLTLCPRR
eukprot:577536-Prymnesium_polylepis.1